MIEKRKSIELIQDRLASAGAPADVRKRYPYQVIEALMGKVYVDMSLSSPNYLNDMAREVSQTVQCSHGKYYTILSPRPVGSHGVLWVQSGSTMIPIDNGLLENKILSKVEPGRIPGCRLVGGTKLEFEKNPGETVCVTLVPDFYELTESDMLITPGAESSFYEMIVQLLRLTDNRPEEFYNDGRDDAMKVQPKNVTTQ